MNDLPYLDPSNSPQSRARDLVVRMELDEKVLQLTAVLPNEVSGAAGMDQASLERRLSKGIGHIAAVGIGTGDSVAIARINNTIQRYLRDNTRLGIPALLHNETLNGVLAEGFTSFPTPIGLAASWDTERVGQMADLVRRQCVSVGIRQGLAPVLDVARDARWGRVHETYGEEVALVSALGVAYVKGLQGEQWSDGVVATAKHFLGYAGTEGGQNTAATHMGPREMYDVHGTPFEAAIKLAGMASVMNSYSEIDGEPAGASRAILTDLLRGTMGFDGTVVSDYRTIQYMVTRLGAAGDATEAAALAIEAGLDLELPGEYGYGANLAAAVRDGVIDEALVDLAVTRVLTHKFALGLFENPLVNEDADSLVALAGAGQELSRELATQSITLLKNDNELLPLGPGVRKVAVIGPHADQAAGFFANYSYPPVLSMLKGLATGKSRMAGMEGAVADLDPATRAEVEKRFAAMAALDPEAIVRETYGAATLVESLRETFPDAEVTFHQGSQVMAAIPGGLEQAASVAEDADVVVLALGGLSGAFAGSTTEGEGTDSATIELPQAQRDLVDAVAQAGTPTVGVFFTGRPYILTEVQESMDAVLLAYFPGPHGARAVADVLSGQVSPSGKLPYTLPRHVGQVPVYQAQKQGSGYHRDPSDMHTGYIDLPSSPLYPFGHGLSYATFEYADLSVDSDSAAAADSVKVSFTVTNDGKFDGVEIAQLYARLPGRGITRAAQELVGFARVTLAPGQTRTVEIELRVAQFGFTAGDGRFVVDPGTVEFRVGSSSAMIRGRATFDITGERTDVSEFRSYLPQVSVR